MILPTMTPQEKVEQAKCITEYLSNYPMEKRQYIYKKVAKAKVFPSYYTAEHDISGMGKWVIIFEAESKNLIRKGVLTVKAYQKYYIGHSRNPLNNGTGIYLCSGDDSGHITLIEYPPHYFNRIRERYVSPKGIMQPNFDQLVKMVLRMQHLSMDVQISGYEVIRGEDGKYLLVKDESNSRQKGYNNFISYHKEGISLGVSYGNKEYINQTTFVPNSLLHEEQLEKQKEALAELRKHEHTLSTNPFATYSRCKYEPIE